MKKGIVIRKLTNNKDFLISEDPMTVLQLHRKLQDMADDMIFSNDEEQLLSIIDEEPSRRYTDHIIEVYYPLLVLPSSFKYLSGGALLNDNQVFDLGVSKEEIYDCYYTSHVKYLKDKPEVRFVPWHLKSEEEQNKLMEEQDKQQVDSYNASLRPIERIFLGMKYKKIW